MKKSKWAAECRGQTKTELNQTLANLLREQFKLKLQKASGELAKKHILAELRYKIACVKTVLAGEVA